MEMERVGGGWRVGDGGTVGMLGEWDGVAGWKRVGKRNGVPEAG